MKRSDGSSSSYPKQRRWIGYGAATASYYRREQAGSSSLHYDISSSSGTVSTTSCSSSGSPLSSISADAAASRHLDLLDCQGFYEETTEEKVEYMKCLVKEFLGAPSTNGSSISALERWFRQLGVGWVLHAADAGAAGELEHISAARSWMRALPQITEIIRSTAALFPLSIAGRFQFARFVQEAMSKMLAFVDVIADPGTTRLVLVSNEVLAQYEKLDALLDVFHALSEALSEIELSFYSRPSEEAESIKCEIICLLSAKKVKAGNAIWSRMEEIKIRILESTEDRDDPSEIQAPQESSDIHKFTRSAVRHISFLQANKSSVAKVVSNAANLGKHAPQFRYLPPLSSLIIEMASCLEKKLASKSESFQDQSLGLLFLLNNSHFICQELQETSPFEFHVFAVTRNFDSYMQSYLQASWEPVLSCLFDPTPLCYGRASPPLNKFDYEFQKTYNAQKQWKVPDPALRKRLRNAITERILPGYTKYIEDNDISTPRVTPQKLEEMLQELFEG